MKAEVDNLHVNKLVNVLISLNNLETEVVDLDVGKLKVVPINLKKWSDVVKNEVVKNTKYNTQTDKRKRIRQENFLCDYFNSH